MIPALVAVVLYLRQDGVHGCQDGDRYVSGKVQPRPFTRRLTGWNANLLAWASWVSVIGVAAMLPTWRHALLFVALPGVWFCVTHPTTVDMPAMVLALASAILWPLYPYAAVALVIMGGCVHERAPVFAALYAWSPWLLLGLVATVILATRPAPSAPREYPITERNLHDHLVDHGIMGALRAHKPYVDLLAWESLVWPLRTLPVLAAWLGCSVAGWCALGLAYASRLVATDTSRCMMWAAPALLLAMPSPPLWIVALHIASFRRGV